MGQKALKIEKRSLQHVLHEYEKNFEAKHGRKVSTHLFLTNKKLILCAIESRYTHEANA